MADAVVYGSRLSPFVEKVVRGLQRKRIAYQLVEPSSPLDLRRWNPQTRKMPVVEMGGERWIDSTFILRRLDERVPEPPLLSPDPTAAAAQRQLEDWADESLYWYTMGVRWSGTHADATADQILRKSPAPAFLRPALRALVKRQFGGLARAQGLGRLSNDVLVAEIGLRLDDLLRILGERPFFYADEPSIADLAVYGQLAMAQSGVTPELGALVHRRPALREYLKRVEQATGG
jgi:glutathione S-transferase